MYIIKYSTFLIYKILYIPYFFKKVHILVNDSFFKAIDCECDPNSIL